ncbi:MAG: 1,4-alpha-glucan-branching enzyme, partial [Armatimonadota bacterium]
MRFGFQTLPSGGIGYREWAPGAHSLHLIGEFNGWDRGADPLQPAGDGEWFIEMAPGRLREGDRVKVHVESDDPPRDRISPWIRQVVPGPEGDWHGVVRLPERMGASAVPALISPAPRIYEAHVGISTEDGSVGSW